MGRGAWALAGLGLCLLGCEKKENRPGPPAPPKPNIQVVSASALNRIGEWNEHAWDVTTPNRKGFLAFRLVDRDGSVQLWSSKIRVGPGTKMRVSLRHQTVESRRDASAAIQIRWSMKRKGQETTGDGEVTVGDQGGGRPALSAGGVQVHTSGEGEPLVTGRWHALHLLAWLRNGTKPVADVPMGEESFVLRLDGRKVDLKTYEFPVLQAHLRFTTE